MDLYSLSSIQKCGGCGEAWQIKVVRAGRRSADDCKL